MGQFVPSKSIDELAEELHITKRQMNRTIQIADADPKHKRIETVKTEERHDSRTDLVEKLPRSYNPGKTRDIVTTQLGISGKCCLPPVLLQYPLHHITSMIGRNK